MILAVEKIESRRCRNCGRQLGSGEFDLSREGRLQATCRMCLVSDSLSEAILKEDWEKANKYKLYRQQRDSHEQRW